MPDPLTKASTVPEIVTAMQSMASGSVLAGMQRVGIRTDNALGLSNPVLQGIAKQIGHDHERAMALWQTGIRDVRVLAIYTAEPARLTAEQARAWADDFESWEIVDIAADLFVAAGLDALIPVFAADEREFVRRAAFAMIAGMAVHRKAEPDVTFMDALPLIAHHAQDARNYVRKAVNWALRNIGKRNLACHQPALALAEQLAASDDKTARWIGSDARRELSSEKVIERLHHKQRSKL